jgi:hypothetical protein
MSPSIWPMAQGVPVVPPVGAVTILPMLPPV